MYLRSITDKDLDAENARVQKETRERDTQIQIDWDKLLELAFNAPGQIVSIARAQAPQATARVAEPSPSTASLGTAASPARTS
jgi:hypothetical protein